jgi:ribonucleoside-diphosphate reductase beta chain
MSVFKKAKGRHTKQPMFFGERVDVARYDTIKYPIFEKQTEKMLSFFWLPTEVDVSKDAIDFDTLTEHEQHIFTSNLKRQILLDSVQGRGITEAITPYTSLPEIEVAGVTWEFFETIHSRSYTHIIRNVYPNPGRVFDTMLDIPEILECADDIAKYYDDFIEYAKIYEMFWDERAVNDQDQWGNPARRIELPERPNHRGRVIILSPRWLKTKLWLCINSINILEGIRFYVSFACSWAFAELKKMEGNAKLIKFICRDENIHLAISTSILKNLVKEDPEFEKIRQSTYDEVVKMFESAVEQEKRWADYLFRDGSMIGLNAKLLKEYVEWIGAKRMRSVGYEPSWVVSRTNPLPWTEKWIGGGSVQVAPQETEVQSYIEGGAIRKDQLDSLKGFEL